MNLSPIEKNVFDPIRILNWYECGVFSNILSENYNKGIFSPILSNTNLVYEKCLSKCQAFEGHTKEECCTYCKDYATHLEEALGFAKKQCPKRDPKCCKIYSGHNDLAYYACVQQQHQINNFFLYLHIFLLILVFFQIYVSYRINQST